MAHCDSPKHCWQVTWLVPSSRSWQYHTHAGAYISSRRVVECLCACARSCACACLGLHVHTSRHHERRVRLYHGLRQRHYSDELSEHLAALIVANTAGEPDVEASCYVCLELAYVAGEAMHTDPLWVDARHPIDDLWNAPQRMRTRCSRSTARAGVHVRVCRRICRHVCVCVCVRSCVRACVARVCVYACTCIRVRRPLSVHARGAYVCARVAPRNFE